MSNDLKNEYIRILWLRYQNSNRKQKAVILNEFCEVSCFTRKYAIKLFNRVPDHWFKKRPGRKKIWGKGASGIVQAIRNIESTLP